MKCRACAPDEWPGDPGAKRYKVAALPVGHEFVAGPSGLDHYRRVS